MVRELRSYRLRDSVRKKKESRLKNIKNDVIENASKRPIAAAVCPGLFMPQLRARWTHLLPRLCPLTSCWFLEISTVGLYTGKQQMFEIRALPKKKKKSTERENPLNRNGRAEEGCA